jgi:hypothetical protein
MGPKSQKTKKWTKASKKTQKGDFGLCFFSFGPKSPKNKKVGKFPPKNTKRRFWIMFFGFFGTWVPYGALNHVDPKLNIGNTPTTHGLNHIHLLRTTNTLSSSGNDPSLKPF